MPQPCCRRHKGPFGVLRVSVTVLILETDPEVTILFSIDGTEVHHCKGLITTLLGDALVVPTGIMDPVTYLVRIGPGGNGAGMVNVSDVHKGIKQSLVAANGAAIVLKSIDEQLELVKINGVGLVWLLFAAFEGGTGFTHCEENVALALKLVHHGLDLL